MLFPALHYWMVSEGGYTGFQAGGAIAIFGASLFLLGAFNNYLVDTFKRKNVCTRSLLLLALLGLLYPYAGEWGMIFLLRVLQGALFGVVLMAMGSTLVIDVTPSQYRNKASVVFTWSGVLGMLCGILLGYNAGWYLSFQQQIYLLWDFVPFRSYWFPWWKFVSVLRWTFRCCRSTVFCFSVP